MIEEEYIQNFERVNKNTKLKMTKKIENGSRINFRFQKGIKANIPGFKKMLKYG